ncbi:hypothetical protein GCM10009733_060800 [Nonomuraea maheshkhaliensis]|uniref:Uncharacterized protein n=1 Tax=Nonomuraea maheshkhaliensis TaxID=419590 RepID=A0ABN2FNU4_9ACTN
MRGPSRRLLLAPVTITATKPLLPTHVKGFLWVDTLFRSTRLVRDLEYYWNPRAANLTGQTIQFWDHLDRRHPDLDHDTLSVEDLGHLYVRFHASGDARPMDRLRHYTERVEREGWVHPSTRAATRDWQRQLGLLGVHDPGLTADRPAAASIDETVELLVRRHLCVDHRGHGGPAYLDGTRWGMPLRPVIGADGHANYLLVILRDLLPRLTEGDQVLLVYDDDLAHDYALLARVLGELGARPSRLPLGRVPIGRAARSSRYGGWDGHSLGQLAELCLREFDPAGYRLGMRLYFIAMLKRTATEPFRADLLRRAMRRAARMLDETGGAGVPGGDGEASETDKAGDGDDLPSYLSGFAAPAGWIDPYRLTDGLFARRPSSALLRQVYL